MHRFLILPCQIHGEHATLRPEQAHQVCRVLRMKPGSAICVVDGRGQECAARLEEVSLRRVVVRLGLWRRCEREPKVHLCLGLGLLKGEKMDWAVQKATEVGVSEVVPLQCARCVVRWEEERGLGKVRRWQRIALEATEQCQRARVPVVGAPISFGSLLERAATFDWVLLAHEGASVSLPQALAAGRRAVQGEPQSNAETSEAWVAPRVLLLVGPEGGFAPEEVRQAQEAGVVAVSLGARTLRAETAAVVGVALVLYELERRGDPT